MAAPRPVPPAMVWFRQDLRISDNPALQAAAATGGPVLPVYILETEGTEATDSWPPGAASRWWLHQSLAALAADLGAACGLPLILRRGDPGKILPDLARESGAAAVFWNRRYEPAAMARDAAVKADLKARGVHTESFNAALLHEPWELRNQSGGYFKVFTPFWRACGQLPPPPAPLTRPKKLKTCDPLPSGEALANWGLQPTRPDWAGGLRQAWTPGERGAQTRLRQFLSDALKDYAAARDRPGQPGTSRLSPHLHFGEISPRQIWQATRMHADAHPASSPDAEKFLTEIGWREFSYHLLYHVPSLPQQNFRPDFDAFPWHDDPVALRAWQRGQTGYPIVDAGMRELWHTGWMHNRVRMIVASFHVKHLRQHWRTGEAWFWDTLVDADLASNAASWQWVAGSGADAAPYFRIFNPILQGERFDPQGAYVRCWVPELAGLPDSFIHKPWTAPEAVRHQAGVVLGRTYPAPIVDHDAARQAALAAFAAIRGPRAQAAAEADVTVKKRGSRGRSS